MVKQITILNGDVLCTKFCKDCVSCDETTKRGYDGFCKKKGYYCHKSDRACKKFSEENSWINDANTAEIGAQKIMTNQPTAIKEHQPDYKDRAWEQYSMEELGQWVSLLTKRATHRKNPEKMKKDLYDARNYLSMMDAKLKDIENSQ
jgi:hypothetical protein